MKFQDCLSVEASLHTSMFLPMNVFAALKEIQILILFCIGAAAVPCGGCKTYIIPVNHP